VNNPTLPVPLLDMFEKRESEARLRRVWGAVASRRRRPMRPWRVHLALSAAFLGLVLSLGVWWHRHPEGQRADMPKRAAVESIIEPGTSARTVDFGEGAYVTVGAMARLDVLEQTSHNLTFALRQGLAQFDIRPGGVRHWQIESAGVTVEVVGTQFSIERQLASVRVEVQRGRVLVRGAQVPDQVLAMEAGRVLTVETAPEPHVPSRQRAAAAVPQNGGSHSAAGRAHPPTRVVSPTSTPIWREAAAVHDWQRAWESLAAEGVAQQSQIVDDLTDLFSLADVARRSGHPAAAINPLQQIIARHSNDPRAAVAAFTLGRVWLESLGNPTQAASAFEQALTMNLPGTLAEDARARLVEALAKSGDIARARVAAEAYHKSYPNGARRADVERWSPPR
jgi:transmembrane sensor